ncbi:MAG: hypothetical protein JWL81_3232 [Verrucomicrobiales bacterium]|nr:hypothetical protein [Verrucomicrobiales bacterium]
MVWRAGHGDEAAMREAMQKICQDYWPPVYAYIRRQGKSEQDAQDLTQDFFCRIIRRNWFAKADPAKGRLRNYLFTCLINFLRDAHRSSMADKRGNGVATLSLTDAEGHYHREAVDHLSPDRLFQRRWAMHLVEKAMETTAREYGRRQLGPLFDALQSRLLEADDAGLHAAELAGQLGMTHGALRVALCRLRNRFREVLMAEVGQTIASTDPAEIRAEMVALLEFL